MALNASAVASSPGAPEIWKNYDFGESKNDDTRTTYTDIMPSAYTVKIATMEAPLSTILVQNRVPYALIANIADKDYLTLSDVAQRFATREETVDPETALEFSMGKGLLDYNKHDTLRYLRRLTAAAALCNTMLTHRGASQAVSSDPMALQHGQQKQLRDTYRQVEGTTIPLDYEGSSCYIKKQLEHTQMGELGAFTNKQIIAGLPDCKVTKDKIQTTTTSGWSTTWDEYRAEPDTEDRWKNQMRTFYHTLTMCIHNCSNHPLFLNFRLDHIKEYYEDFIFGEEILHNRSAASLKVVMVAERKAWNNLLKTIYKKQSESEPYTLTEGLKELRSKTMYWTNELSHRSNDNNKGKGRSTMGKLGKGKGKPSRGKGYGYWSQSTPYRPTWNQEYQKGKGKHAKGKSGGKQHTKKGGKSKNKNKDKSIICNNFHYYQGCAGSCGRSHRCPECGENHRWKDFHE